MEAFDRDLCPEDMTYRCAKCNKGFLTQNTLDHHIHRKHYSKSQILPYSETTVYCKLCDLNFRSSGGFVQHRFKIHSLEMDAFKKDYTEKDMIYQCRICKKKVATDLSLKSHMSRKHYKNRKKKVKLENQERYCQLCYIVYKKAYFLEKHKKKVHANEMEAFDRDLRPEDMTYRCAKCNKSFLTQNTLDHHIHRKHSSKSVDQSAERVFCRLCHVTYKREETLKRHMEVKHKDDAHLLDQVSELSGDSSCQMCDKKFLRDDFLQYHMKYEHHSSQGHPSYCQLCYLPFKFPSAVRKHQSNVHKGDLWALKVQITEDMLQHPCQQCDKKFLSESLLKHHGITQHKGLKDNVSYCGLCYVDFKFNSNLKAHISKIHTSREENDALSVKLEASSLPYGCKFCEKKFLTKNIQRYHNIHSHKEEKQKDLKCEFCGQVFIFKYHRKQLMANHMRLKHNVHSEDSDGPSQGTEVNDAVKSFMQVLNSLRK